MRATEFIRNILDLIDMIETPKPNVVVNVEVSDNPMKQIQDLLPSGEETTYANQPQEEYASINAVTTNAGGGVNGPKNPRDLRGNSFPIYPENS
jgi:hypothetical protein